MAQDRSIQVRGSRNLGIFALTASLLLLGCDDQDSADSGVMSGSSEPSQSDLLQGNSIAGAAGAGAIVPKSESDAPPLGSGDLEVLGGDANQNQQAFRERFGLADPTQDQLAQWDEYDARLTAYSNKDADWPYPTAASSNWMGATSDKASRRPCWSRR